MHMFDKCCGYEGEGPSTPSKGDRLKSQRPRKVQPEGAGPAGIGAGMDSLQGSGTPRSAELTGEKGHGPPRAQGG